MKFAYEIEVDECRDWMHIILKTLYLSIKGIIIQEKYGIPNT